MKIVAKLAAIMLFPGILLAQKPGITFTSAENWGQVLTRAKKENKHVFVDAYSTQKGQCKMMHEKIYTSPEVGDFYNKNFISVKVQMDRTISDDQYTRGWYEDANHIKVRNSVTAYPTYLFFSPDGKLVHRELGLKDETQFIVLGKNALDPEKQVYVQLRNWRSGYDNYVSMPDLYRLAQQLGDDLLKDSVARYYKNYLSGLKEEALLNKSNIEFLYALRKLVSSKDLVFNIAMSHPEKLNKLCNKEIAAELVNFVIINEEILSQISDQEAQNISQPSWEIYQNSIAKKYPAIDAVKMVLEQKIKHYRKRKDWKNYTEANDTYFEHYKDSFTSHDAHSKMNVAAWDIFQFSNDASLLRKALKWSDVAIKLSPANLQIADTKANLLYKLGCTEEAIALEEAICLRDQKLANEHGSGYISLPFVKTLEKMKKGEQTW